MIPWMMAQEGAQGTQGGSVVEEDIQFSVGAILILESWAPDRAEAPDRVRNWDCGTLDVVIDVG